MWRMVWLLRIYLLWVGGCVSVFVFVCGWHRVVDGWCVTASRELELWVCERVFRCVFTTNGHHKRCRPMGLSMRGLDEQRMSCRLVLRQLVLIQWFCALESRLGWQRHHVHGQHWMSMLILPLECSIHMNQHERLEYWIEERKLCVHRKKHEQMNIKINSGECEYT